MPVTREKKHETIEQLRELISRSKVVIVSDYRGLTAGQLSQLRNKLRPLGSRMMVAKNTLVLRSLADLGMPQPEDLLQGPTVLSFVFGDLGQPVRAILDFARETEFLKVKGGLMGSLVIGAGDVAMLPTLPSEQTLRAEALGALTAPVSGLVGVLDSALRGLLYVLDARAEQLGQH